MFEQIAIGLDGVAPCFLHTPFHVYRRRRILDATRFAKEMLDPRIANRRSVLKPVLSCRTFSYRCPYRYQTRRRLRPIIHPSKACESRATAHSNFFFRVIDMPNYFIRLPDAIGYAIGYSRSFALNVSCFEIRVTSRRARRFDTCLQTSFLVTLHARTYRIFHSPCTDLINV